MLPQWKGRSDTVRRPSLSCFPHWTPQGPHEPRGLEDDVTGRRELRCWKQTHRFPELG